MELATMHAGKVMNWRSLAAFLGSKVLLTKVARPMATVIAPTTAPVYDFIRVSSLIWLVAFLLK